MPPNPLLVLLLIKSFLKPSLSLSSQSPQDLLAYPKYTVSLADWNSAIINSSATSILSSSRLVSEDALSVSGNAKDGTPEANSPVYRQRLMRTTSGQAFLCAVPPLPELKPLKKPEPSLELTVNDQERLQQKARIEKEGLKRGLDLLESLKDHCIYTRLGWFTYSFCYGQGEIRQFHAVMIPGHNHPHEDPEQDIYILGLHVDHPQNPHHQARVEGTLPSPSPTSASGELTSLGRNRFSAGPVNALSEVMPDETGSKSDLLHDEEEFEQKRYLVQRWEGGTICDLTGKARAVEVQFHCSTVGTDHIALLRETSICEYLLIIHTPRLCSEPLFLDGGGRSAGTGGSDDVGRIECRPVLSEEEIENWNAREAGRKAKEAKEEEAQQQKAIDDTLRSAASAEAIGQIEAMEGAESDRSQPVSPSEQTVLSGAEQASKSPSDDQLAPSTSSQEDSKSAKDSTEEATTVVMDPITVFFDTDTGKIYMDEADTNQQHRSEPSQPRNHEQAPASETRASADQNEQAGDSPPSLEELTKALRESLGAVLRDLREEGGQGRQVQPQPLSELINALKESGSTKLRKPRSGPKKEKQVKKQLKPRKAKPTQNLPGSGKNHQKLLQMYQNKFEVKKEQKEEESS